MRGAGCRKQWPGWGTEETEEQRRDSWKGQIRTLNQNSGKGQWEGDVKDEEQEEEGSWQAPRKPAAEWY